jgi:hypothetical protein
MTDVDTLKCLHCSTEIYTEGDIIPQCPKCSFYNVKLQGDDFKEFMEIYDLDPIFVHKKKINSGFLHYAWPPLTKEEYFVFREKSPDRAEALLKKLKGKELTEKEHLNLRVLKSINKKDRRDLEGRLRYLKIKKKIITLLDNIK